MKRKKESYQLPEEVELNISNQHIKKQVSSKQLKYLYSFNRLTIVQGVEYSEIRERATSRQLGYAIGVLVNGGYVTIK